MLKISDATWVAYTQVTTYPSALVAWGNDSEHTAFHRAQMATHYGVIEVTPEEAAAIETAEEVRRRHANETEACPACGSYGRHWEGCAATAPFNEGDAVQVARGPFAGPHPRKVMRVDPSRGGHMFLVADVNGRCIGWCEAGDLIAWDDPVEWAGEVELNEGDVFDLGTFTLPAAYGYDDAQAEARERFSHEMTMQMGGEQHGMEAEIKAVRTWRTGT